MNESLLVLAAVVLFFFLGLVLPVIRLWRRERIFGVVAHRFLAAGMSFWLLLLLAWGVAVAVLPAETLGIHEAPVALRIAGWLVIAAGLAMLMAAQAQMGAAWRIGIDARPTSLVTHGLYGAVRNPIYTAMSLMLLGLCAVVPSIAMGAAWLVTSAAAAIQTRREERHLLGLHGATYRAYAARVGRFLPALGRLS